MMLCEEGRIAIREERGAYGTPFTWLFSYLQVEKDLFNSSLNANSRLEDAGYDVATYRIFRSGG